MMMNKLHKRALDCVSNGIEYRKANDPFHCMEWFFMAFGIAEMMESEAGEEICWFVRKYSPRFSGRCFYYADHPEAEMMADFANLVNYSDLKPCPFCGGEAEKTWLSDTYGDYFSPAVSCKGCKANISGKRELDTVEDYDYSELVSKWNKRGGC